MKNGRKCAAIVLAAGVGKRMGADVPKQFIKIDDKPILYYSLRAFENSFIDEIVLVVRSEDIDYCQEMVREFSFSKVTKVTVGGAERYHSVALGLEAIDEADFVFIHDGARCCVTQQVLNCTFDAVSEYGAAVASVPSKDTVKIANAEGFAKETPSRDTVYIIQTPQVFDFNAIRECYRKLIAREGELAAGGIKITDDAMVMEFFGEDKVFLCGGDYRNIKVTTPNDLVLAEIYLKEIAEDENRC